MTDSVASRLVMVDSQIRPSDVTKYPVIDAFLTVPRETYVPAANRQTAYVDDNIPIAPGRTVLAPRTLAKLLDALDIGQDEMILDLGCGYGYSTAIAACLAEAVVAVEEDSIFAKEAQGNLLEEGIDNAVVVEAPLNEGAAQHGPYDVIVIQGAVESVPDALLAQLKEGGRIACLTAKEALGQAQMGVKSGAHVSWRWLFDAGAPVLPGFAQAREFQL